MSFSFQNFDLDSDIGHLDEEGRFVRPRKKPGRKPKSASIRHHNDQRPSTEYASRSKVRQEKYNAKMMKIKHYIQARDDAMEQVNLLRQKLTQLVLENDYLRDCTQTLKRACLAHHISVPTLCDGFDNATSRSLETARSTSKRKHEPHALDIFMEKHRHLVDLGDKPRGNPTHGEEGSTPFTASSATYDNNHRLPCSSHSESSGTVAAHSRVHVSPTSLSIMDTDSTLNATDDTPLDVASIAPLLASHLESPFCQRLFSVVNTSPMMQVAASPIDTSAGLLESDLQSWLQHSANAWDTDFPLYLEDTVQSGLQNNHITHSKDHVASPQSQPAIAVASERLPTTRPTDALSLLSMQEERHKEPKTLEAERMCHNTCPNTCPRMPPNKSSTALQKALARGPHRDREAMLARRGILALFKDYHCHQCHHSDSSSGFQAAAALSENIED